MEKLAPISFCLQKLDGNIHQIYLYDDISKHGEFNWETWEYDESETSAKHFRDLLDAIPETDDIELHFNTNGGSVSEGTAIYNLLQQHGGKKTGIVDGVCHSIAFTILQACDTRIMGDGTSAIIHNMWTTATGNAKQLRDTAAQLDAYMESCIALFMKRCTVSEEQLRKMMDAETVLTPQDALSYGLIDKIGAKAETGDPDPLQLMQENQTLRQQLREKEFTQEQLKNFLMANPVKKEPEQRTDPFRAFFSGKKGETK